MSYFKKTCREKKENMNLSHVIKKFMFLIILTGTLEHLIDVPGIKLHAATPKKRGKKQTIKSKKRMPKKISTPKKKKKISTKKKKKGKKRAPKRIAKKKKKAPSRRLPAKKPILAKKPAPAAPAAP